MGLADDMRQELAAAIGQGERQVQRVLKRYPGLVRSAFFSASNLQWAKPEFALGNQFRVDWIAVYGFSGGYNIHLIELESPTARLYTKDGLESDGLRLARKQLEDWTAWERGHHDFFRKELSRAMEPAKLPDASFRYKYAHQAILDPTVYTQEFFQVVVGRRQSMSDEERERRDAASYLMDGPFIVTYDRFLDRASRFSDKDAQWAIECG